MNTSLSFQPPARPQIASALAIARANVPLMVLLFASLAWLVLSIFGLAFDTRSVGNAPAWAKSFKFSVSLIAYVPAVIWALNALGSTPVRRVAHIAGAGVGITLLAEIAVILLQTVRGEASHFNVSSPLNAALWSVMAISITTFWVMHAIVMVLLWRKPEPDPARRWAIRLAFVVTLIGFLQGYSMTGPNAAQLAVLQSGALAPMIGAHTVGAPDGGAGLPLLGWSTINGDLRIGHFIGIHAMQVIPLIYALLRRAGVPAATHVRPTWLSALTWLGLMALVTWQALRGESIIAPTLPTFIAAAAGVVLTAGLAFAWTRPATRGATA